MGDNELLTQRVSKALDIIRPYLKTDGGDIELIQITDEKVAIVKLIGACSACQNNYQTMKNGVESIIKREVPEIKSVIAQ